MKKQKVLKLIRREYLRGYLKNMDVTKYTPGLLGKVYRQYLKEYPSVRREVSLLFPKKKSK